MALVGDAPPRKGVVPKFVPPSTVSDVGVAVPAREELSAELSELSVKENGVVTSAADSACMVTVSPLLEAHDCFDYDAKTAGTIGIKGKIMVVPTS